MEVDQLLRKFEAIVDARESRFDFSLEMRDFLFKAELTDKEVLVFKAAWAKKWKYFGEIYNER